MIDFTRQTLQPEVTIHVIYRAADKEALMLVNSPYVSEWSGSRGAALTKHEFKSTGGKTRH